MEDLVAHRQATDLAIRLRLDVPGKAEGEALDPVSATTPAPAHAAGARQRENTGT